MDAADISLTELFRLECESQCRVLNENLVELETAGASPARLEALMRAAHSLKGAARIVNLDAAVRIAHALEHLFVACQKAERAPTRTETDSLLKGVDLLERIGAAPDEEQAAFSDRADTFVQQLATITTVPAETEAVATPPEAPATEKPAETPADETRSLRVSAESLNHLLGSAAEALVATRRLRTFTQRLWHSHRHQRKTAQALEQVSAFGATSAVTRDALHQVQALLEEGDRLLVDGIAEWDRYDRQSVQLAERMYDEALGCRMRPFSDITTGLRRAARDAARHVDRLVEVEIVGQGTEVDRDLLERLESPLGHLIRNAVEHGIESAAQRQAAGKPAAGRIRVEAAHSAGFLVIRVSDDGGGIDREAVKQQIMTRQLAPAETVDRLAPAELLDFLFLPGFTMKADVSELSGRGVGLDVVRSLTMATRGTVRVASEKGAGATFTLQFPVSLSVMRALQFELAGEAYAAPLARVERVVRIPATAVESVEGHQFFPLEEERLGLVDGASVLGVARRSQTQDTLPILVLADAHRRFGVVVDRFVGEGEVVIQPLDRHLGRVRNIAAAALTEDGRPMLLIDVDDFLLSVERRAQAGERQTVVADGPRESSARQQILVVDDSITVRELERKLITALGYAVETAVDGADGWNAVRGGAFAAVVTDIDMPRMDGFELTRLIKGDPRLRDIPVIIVSYKDREEDRRQGLEAGADYYLTKGSFQDEGLARALADVLGGGGAE